jgi:acetylornithine/N-succinyldiaminopimelate aminotransferase
MSVQWNDVMLGNYGEPKLNIVSGDGCYVIDSQGRRYLDLLAGIAVSSLGHAHPAIVAAVSQQASKLIHTSNLYSHQPAVDLAAKLLSLAKMQGKVFFSQDGATANEAALKLARRYGMSHNRHTFIAMTNSFHGRTMGALAVTGNPTKREPFGPFGYEVKFVPYGDEDALLAACDESVAAVIVESGQGEGGIVIPDSMYLDNVRAITRDAGALMIVDEVQSGIGRTGAWFASSHVAPDIITLAKGIAGGMPLGAVLVDNKFAGFLAPGDHGTTFGGNPVSCAAALAVISTIENENLLQHVQSTGEWLLETLRSLALPGVVQVRGVGLWIGIVFDTDCAADVEAAALSSGFLINAVKPKVIRLAPPLVITREELLTFIEALPFVVGAAK